MSWHATYSYYGTLAVWFGLWVCDTGDSPVGSKGNVDMMLFDSRSEYQTVMSTEQLTKSGWLLRVQVSHSKNALPEEIPKTNKRVHQWGHCQKGSWEHLKDGWTSLFGRQLPEGNWMIHCLAGLISLHRKSPTMWYSTLYTPILSLSFCFISIPMSEQVDHVNSEDRQMRPWVGELNESKLVGVVRNELLFTSILFCLRVGERERERDKGCHIHLQDASANQNTCNQEQGTCHHSWGF